MADIRTNCDAELKVLTGPKCRRIKGIETNKNSMAWIKTIDENNAEGKLKELYAKLIEPWGGVDNILKIHSLNPPSLSAHFELYKTLMRGRSELSRAQREMIAVTVSAVNQCDY